MNGIEEIARFNGISEYILRRQLTKMLQPYQLEHLEGNNSREVIFNLEKLLGEDKKQTLGLREFTDTAGHELHLVA